MDIKELNKTQLILLTLLITFVVSIASAIVTVSLMKQMPKDIPQTINNVIERTIEKVTTVQAPPVVKEVKVPIEQKENTVPVYGDGNSLISVYALGQLKEEVATTSNTEEENKKEPKALGQGVIISDIGLILIDSNILTNDSIYNVELNKKIFEVSLLKKFDNGFSVLKIDPPKSSTDVEVKTENKEDISKVD
jgi:hypothetical protein